MVRSALSSSAVEKSGGRLLSGACRRKLRHWSWTRRSNFLSLDAFATLSRWAATALAFTGGWFILGGRCAALNRRMRDQLFRLERLKSIFEVDSSHLWRLAASRDSIRWSAMSGSPDSSYCFNRALHSTSIHGMYAGLNPRGIAEWAWYTCIVQFTHYKHCAGTILCNIHTPCALTCS